MAERLGARFDKDVEARTEEARYVGDFKTSMLQDFEAVRPIAGLALPGGGRGRAIDVHEEIAEMVQAGDLEQYGFSENLADGRRLQAHVAQRPAIPADREEKDIVTATKPFPYRAID